MELFLKKLFSKSNQYVLVWAYIISKSDEVDKISIFEIMAQTKTKKSLFYLILKYGISNIDDSNEVKYFFQLQNNYILISKDKFSEKNKKDYNKKSNSKKNRRN